MLKEDNQIVFENFDQLKTEILLKGGKIAKFIWMQKPSISHRIAYYNVQCPICKEDNKFIIQYRFFLNHKGEYNHTSIDCNTNGKVFQDAVYCKNCGVGYFPNVDDV